MSRISKAAFLIVPAALVLTGCTGPGETEDASSTSSTGGSASSGDASCSDPNTDLGGDHVESRTLHRACSPYRLVGSGAIFTGEGVELTIEDGVRILADADAHLRVESGARLVAGSGSGERVTLASHPDATGPWAAVMLSGPVVHELHRVTLYGGRGTTTEEGEAALYIDGEALLDQVTLEQPVDVGVRVHRDGSRLAPGTNGLVVRGAGGYPVVLDAQNLPTLPADQDLTSSDPDKNRVLVFGGDDGSLTGNVLWQRQRVDIEIGVDLHIGTSEAECVLELPARQVFRLREAVDLYLSNGKILAEGAGGCENDPGACTVVFDAASAGAAWGSMVFTSSVGNTLANASILRNVRFVGGGGNLPMVAIYGPGGPGVIGDCAPTVTIEGSRFEGSNCLEAIDTQNAYGALNRFVGCTAETTCD
jgi:hypothetical protein